MFRALNIHEKPKKSLGILRNLKEDYFAGANDVRASWDSCIPVVKEESGGVCFNVLYFPSCQIFVTQPLGISVAF